DLGGPATHKRRFDAAADRVGEELLGRFERPGERRRALDLAIAIDAAASGVDHHAIKGVTDPATGGGEPRHLGGRREGIRTGRAVEVALLVADLEISFDAEDDRADLVVVTGLRSARYTIAAAVHRAGRGDAGKRVDHRDVAAAARPAVADVGADVE